MSLRFPHEFDAALLHLFLDTEGPRAIGTSALDIILHRLEITQTAATVVSAPKQTGCSKSTPGAMPAP